MEELKIDQEILLVNIKVNPQYKELEPIGKRTFVTTGRWRWTGDEDIWCGSNNIGILTDVYNKNPQTKTKGVIVGRFTVRRLHNHDPETII